MNRRDLMIALLPLLCAACGSEQHQDVKQWMTDNSKDLRGGIKALPEVKPFPVVSYNAADLPDPFQATRIEPEKKQSGGGIKPDFDRPREELESYPLETLKFVGMIKNNKDLFAIIAVAGEKKHYRVKKGNFMGESFGIVTEIQADEGVLTLKELVQDATGDWVERTSTLELQQSQEAKK